MDKKDIINLVAKEMKHQEKMLKIFESDKEMIQHYKSKLQALKELKWEIEKWK